MGQKKNTVAPSPSLPPSSVYTPHSFQRRRISSPHKRSFSASSQSLFPAPSLRDLATPPRAHFRAQGTSGCGLQTTAARSRPVHARALAVAGGLRTHIPRATGGATRAAGDSEACRQQ